MKIARVLIGLVGGANFVFVALSSPVEIVGAVAKLTSPDPYTLVGDRHFVDEIEPFDEFGNINIVVEIPSGTTRKWEVDKASGALKWEFKEGKPRIVNYLGYPGNYGMIPRTLLPKEAGSDGDPLDVIVLGPAVHRGSVVSARPVGILKLLDRGEQDDKIIAVADGSEMAQCHSIEDLKREYRGVVEIIEIWFSNYKGPGQLESQGFGSESDARTMIDASINAYADAHRGN